MIDIKMLKEEFRPIDLLKHLGVRYRKSGKNIFILCPEHEERTGKADRRIGNCILGKSFDDMYYCFACGARGNAVSFVAHTENLDPENKSDFRQIINIIADSTGRREAFEYDDNTEIRKPKEEKGIVSREDCETLGIPYLPQTIVFNEVFSEDFISSEDIEKYMKFVDYAGYKKSVVCADVSNKRIDIGREEYLEKVKKIAEEKIKKIDFIISEMKSIQVKFGIADYEAEAIISKLNQKKQKIKSLA